jgi:hypothetical protein
MWPEEYCDSKSLSGFPERLKNYSVLYYGIFVIDLFKYIAKYIGQTALTDYVERVF